MGPTSLAWMIMRCDRCWVGMFRQVTVSMSMKLPSEPEWSNRGSKLGRWVSRVLVVHPGMPCWWVFPDGVLGERLWEQGHSICCLPLSCGIRGQTWPPGGNFGWRLVVVCWPPCPLMSDWTQWKSSMKPSWDDVGSRSFSPHSCGPLQRFIDEKIHEMCSFLWFRHTLVTGEIQRALQEESLTQRGIPGEFVQSRHQHAGCLHRNMNPKVDARAWKRLIFVSRLAKSCCCSPISCPWAESIWNKSGSRAASVVMAK